MLNNKGFTLLEALIAILLLAILTLWNMQAMLTAYGFTSRNQIRDEAVLVVGEELTDYRNKPFSTLAAGTIGPTNIQRQIRNYDQSFTVNTDIVNQEAGIAYSVKVTASWVHKGNAYTYSATTIVGDK